MIAIGQSFAERPCSFDYLRLGLAIAIMAFHGVTVSYGSAEAIPPAWAAGARLILPGFFALSGFLVTASLERSQGPLEFIGLRLLRLGPALLAVVLASMFLLGPLMTTLDLGGYFASPSLYAYLTNLAGLPAFGLPHVFDGNPRSGVVNGALWTLPIESKFYLLLAAAGLMGMTRLPRTSAALLALVIAASALALVPAPGGGLGLAFAGGVLLFLLKDSLPLNGAAGWLCLAAAYGLSAHPRWQFLAGLPLAYGVVWLGCLKPPRLSGDYSYGLYLAGYPLQQCLVQILPRPGWWQTFAISLPIGMLLAALLWHLVEKPVLDRKHRILSNWCLPRMEKIPLLSRREV